jgi:hypothetical protein
MHSSLQELADLLDAERDALLATWAQIPADARERRPAPDQWTPAELMEHLRMVESGSTRLLARRLERAREAGLGRETNAASRVDGLDQFDIADNPARYPAPEAVVPPADVRAEGVEAGLAESRDALRALLAAADGLALGEVRAMHLRFGDIDMYQWLLFLAQHERRHARQLGRMREMLVDEPAAR